MIIKLSSSLKQLQVVGDPVWSDEHQRDVSWVYGTSVVALKGLVESGSSGRFLLLSRLPFPVLGSRFPISPLYKGVTSLDLDKLSGGRDSFSSVVRSDDVVVKDFVVDWDSKNGGGL